MEKKNPRRSFTKILEEIFCLDVRSLAALRIGVAAILLFSLAFKAVSINEYYTDQGVIQKESVAFSTHPFAWSIHALNGSFEFQALLFTIAGVFALLLLVGYKTKVATIISFILIVSLENRNIMIADGSDDLLRILLFWGIFLPWNARYSVDSVKNAGLNKLPQRVFSAGTLGYLLQIVIVYLTTSLFKSGPEWTRDYTALYYTLSYEIFGSPQARMVLNFQPLLIALTFFVKWFELIGSLIFLSPIYTSYLRIAAILLFVSMHIGIAGLMTIGFFPFVSIVSFFGLLPSLFWDKIFVFLSKNKSFKIKIYYDSDCGFCRKIVYYVRTFFLLPSTELIPAPNDPEVLTLMQKENSFVVEESSGKRLVRSEAIFTIIKASPVVFPFALIANLPLTHKIIDRIYNFIAIRRHAVCPIRSKKPEVTSYNIDFSLPFNIVAAVFVAYIMLWNLQHFIPKIDLPTPPGYILGLWQKWNMFSPTPPKQNGWYVMMGKLENGKIVNLLSPGDPVSWEDPKRPLYAYDYKFKNVLEKLNLRGQRRFQVLYVDYLCRNWNSTHPPEKKLSVAEISFMLKETPPPGSPAPLAVKQNIISRDCNSSGNFYLETPAR